MLKWLKGWRTMAVATATSLLSLLDMLNAIDLKSLLSAVTGEKQTGIIMLAMSVTMALMRWISTTPAGQKEQ